MEIKSQTFTINFRFWNFFFPRRKIRIGEVLEVFIKFSFWVSSWPDWIDMLLCQVAAGEGHASYHSLLTSPSLPLSLSQILVGAHKNKYWRDWPRLLDQIDINVELLTSRFLWKETILSIFLEKLIVFGKVK